jgi:hypothetical protein
MAGLDPANPRLGQSKKGVDARVKPGHDEERASLAMTAERTYGTMEIGEKSTNQLLGWTKPLTFGLMARGATSWAT